MKRYKELAQSLVEMDKAQSQIDNLIKDIVKKKLSPNQWDEFFEILYKSEKSGMSVDKLSPVSKLNYKSFKRRQGYK